MTMQGEKMKKHVLIPIADGTEEMEAVTIIDVLRRAGCEVTVASVGEQFKVTASRGVKIEADAMIGKCKDKEYDLIVLPGGLPGADHLRDCADLIEMLKAQKAAGRLYAAICASPAVVLVPHGLLEGKKATCYPSCQDELPDLVPDKRVVVDGNCITSLGPGSAVEFALELVRQLFDVETMQKVAGPMCVK